MPEESLEALIAALFDGVIETPPWGSFLDLLRIRAGADHGILIFRQPGRRLDESVHVLSSCGAPARAERLDSSHFFPIAPFPGQDMIEGRQYALDELRRLNEQSQTLPYEAFVQSFGITAIRQVRVREPSGIDAVLTLTRAGDDFDDDISGLLERLTPILRGALQLHIIRERERFSASLNAEAIRRLQFGWFVVDGRGHILEADEQGRAVLDSSGTIRETRSGRLSARHAEVDREISRAIEAVTQGTAGRPRAITLSRDPWLDMLIMPAKGRPMAAETAAAVIYIHGDNWGASDRAEQLAELFGLSPREACLALALSRGMNLAEAAESFGLTIGSARTYSKTIYAKTGARGLPDLVRIVMRSVLAIAPDT